MAEGFSSEDTFLSDVHVATSGTPSDQVGPSIACTVCCRCFIPDHTTQSVASVHTGS